MKISALTLLIPLTMAMRDGEMELLLVHGIWRHGDRSPTTTFPTDPIQEADWTFGGGGFGQLSPLGMAQHLKFGKALRKLYVDTGFLSEKYSSNEIYIRSTDINRTIISAMSNMLGMYGQNNDISQAGIDYPNEVGWPAGYVPIPVHTVDYDTDHIGNTDAECRRRSLLWNMAKTSPEIKTFQQKPNVVKLFRQLTKYCGETITFENFWTIQDVLFIEQLYKNETLREKNKWFTDELFNEINDVNNQIIFFENGIFDKTLVMNNLDIGLEIKKIRGGSLFNDINTRMNMKLYCMNRIGVQCNWIRTLKYYVYSLHDTNVYALLSILGIEKKVIQTGGYPSYTAAVFIELWMNHTDNHPYFKILYHKNGSDDTIHPINKFIDLCGNSDYCNLDIFNDFATRTKPDEPMDKWCIMDPQGSSTSSWALFTIAFATLSHLWLSE